MRTQCGVLREKKTKLIVRAPHDGVIVTAYLMLFMGALVKEGKPICEMVDPKSIRVVAAMSQDEALLLYERPREDYDVEMRLVSNVGHVFSGGSVRVIDAGHAGWHTSHCPILAAVPSKPSIEEAHGMAKNPQFEVHLTRSWRLMEKLLNGWGCQANGLPFDSH